MAVVFRGGGNVVHDFRVSKIKRTYILIAILKGQK
jgi:hypothetical protein